MRSMAGNPNPPSQAKPSWTGLVKKALEISRKRSEALALLRAALERGDDTEALRLARELCGIEHEQKSDPTHPSVDRRAGGRRPCGNPGPARNQRTNRY